MQVMRCYITLGGDYNKSLKSAATCAEFEHVTRVAAELRLICEEHYKPIVATDIVAHRRATESFAQAVGLLIEDLHEGKWLKEVSFSALIKFATFVMKSGRVAQQLSVGNMIHMFEWISGRIKTEQVSQHWFENYRFSRFHTLLFLTKSMFTEIFFAIEAPREDSGPYMGVTRAMLELAVAILEKVYIQVPSRRSAKQCPVNLPIYRDLALSLGDYIRQMLDFFRIYQDAYENIPGLPVGWPTGDGAPLVAYTRALPGKLKNGADPYGLKPMALTLAAEVNCVYPSGGGHIQRIKPYSHIVTDLNEDLRSGAPNLYTAISRLAQSQRANANPFDATIATNYVSRGREK